MNKALLLAVALLFVLVAPAAASASPPSNDNFGNSESITDRFGWAEGDNTEATKEPGEPNHAGNPGGHSVWYSWTAPYAGRATFSTCYSDFDTLLAVYTGDQVDNLQQVAADDNGCGNQSRVSFMTSRRCHVPDRRRRRERCDGLLRARLGRRACERRFRCGLGARRRHGRRERRQLLGDARARRARARSGRLGLGLVPMDCSVERAGHVRALRQRLRHAARRLHGRERRWSVARRAGLQRLSGRLRLACLVSGFGWTGVPHRRGRRLRGARRHRASLESHDPRSGEP